MSVQSSQALRLLKFVAEMKKNNYPNAESFSELLRKIDLEENISCARAPRTILRDIKVLEECYHAPIDYDSSRRGYYLKRPWNFEIPVLEDDIISMTLLGTKLAGDILPEPLKGKVDLAVDKTLAANNSEFFDEAMIESLLCASGIKAAVEPAIFKKIFDAWRQHQAVLLKYAKPDGEISEYEFEPHMIAFHKGVWYTKGYTFETKEVRIYAIQRIREVTFGIGTFDTDKKLLAHTKRNGLFEYPKIDGIRLHCDSSIAFYLYEHQKVKKFKIEPQEDGSLIITLRPAFEHEVIRWVLGEGGSIRVLYPEDLREKVALAGKKIFEMNS